MTPQLVDHAHTDSCIAIPPATSHIYFWSQSHHSHDCEQRLRYIESRVITRLAQPYELLHLICWVVY